MKRLRARHLPADDADCGWIAPLPDRPPALVLRGNLRVDTAVVGAGFTGLAAARRLAELAPDREVAVLDAQRAGFGAAGRSSGFVVDLAGFIAALPPAHADRFIRLSRRGIALLRRRVEDDGIHCAWDDAGWYHVAATPAGLESLAGLEAWLHGRGEVYERLDREGMRARVGTGYYRAGLRLPGSVLVDPAALVHGLADALPESVTLFEESPVVEIRPGAPAELRTPDGAVTADRVLVATNGGMAALGLLRQRVFPLWTFGSFTRPLTADEGAALGGDAEWGVLAQDVLGTSLRRTRDQRILVRNGVHFERSPTPSEAVRAEARREHRRAFRARFPQLAHLVRDDAPGGGFAHTWGGVMGISANGRHHFGALGKNLWGAAGYNAAGIALGTVSGHLLADAALGRDSDDLRAMHALPDPRWFPPPLLADPGIRWRIRRMERQAGGKI